VPLAELVLVMEAHHREELGNIDPAVRGKTFLLGHWQKFEVPDPYQRPRAVWDDSIKLIDEGVNAWVKRLCLHLLLQAVHRSSEFVHCSFVRRFVSYCLGCNASRIILGVVLSPESGNP
jgi:hypothetical protein